MDDPDDAVAGLIRLSDAAVGDGHLVLAGMALHDGLRLGGAAQVTEPLARIAIATDSALVRAFATHARATARGDGSLLDAVSETFESMGALQFAAEAAAHAAEAHDAAGDAPARAAAAWRSEVLLDRCPGAAAPWHAGARGVALQGRQLEVARLAARGASSRSIAQQLFVSVRTVDNHLYRIYNRLGVSNREGLATVLRLVGSLDSE
jgi:DNA-binding CsgD family transcriptional regulator